MKRADAVVMAAATATATTAAAAAPDCFHCGLPAPQPTRWTAAIDDVIQPMCCPGCQAVAISIVANGLSAYYHTRDGFSSTASLIPAELTLYDAPAMAHAFGTEADCCDAVFSIEGLRCAACVWLIESRLARLPGMQRVSLNVATERLHLRWQRDACQPSSILHALREIGYPAYPYDPVRHDAQLERARKTLFRQLFIAALSMMQVMMYALPAYIATVGAIDTGMANLMRWAGLCLTLPAVLYAAQPFFRGAWQSLKNRALGMDVPVALGIAAAFGASLVATWRGSGVVYFDSVTMFIFLLLCSRYLELTARRKAASALNALHHALPASALRLLGAGVTAATELVAADQLREHDLILVRPGEAIAADGVLMSGTGAIDASLLTGESTLQAIAIGNTVPGGAINVSQPIVVRVTRAAVDSTLSVLVKLVEQAGSGKPQLALWADRVAAWFVAALLVFAVLVFVIWQVVDPSRAWPIAIAILVVSCPCALSLATPTALAAATDRLVRQGVLIVRPHVLETLQRATHVVFDKTGTLTLGRPSLQHLHVMGQISRQRCLHRAALLEGASSHPLALGILQAASAVDLSRYCDETVDDLRQHVGQGWSGSFGGRSYRLGSAAFVAALTGSAPVDTGPADVSAVFLANEEGMLARFDLADSVRAEAADVVRHMQSLGKKVVLLSGDRQAVAQRVAAQLGIDTAQGDTLPEQKLAYVQRLQREGAVVAMVGDGINDAAVLRAADVSFAMGSGTALAQIHADCVLLAGRFSSSSPLSALSEVTDCAAAAMRVIRQNLVWASVYNLLAIPAAALGLLNPWMSALGMSVSSAVVVLNALRMRRSGTSTVATKTAHDQTFVTAAR